MTVLGKGNKERLLYLNNACIRSLEEYLKERSQIKSIKDKNALFLSSRGTRITARRVQQIIQRSLEQAGLAGQGFSTHKLRHTAATLLLPARRRGYPCATANAGPCQSRDDGDLYSYIQPAVKRSGRKLSA